MNRRIAKKILRNGTKRGNGAARAKWMRDVHSGDKRRLGRWGPSDPAHRALACSASTPGSLRLWWLSFVDGDTGAFLGACQVPATHYTQAVQVAHFLGCNPGGEVRGRDIRPEIAFLIPEQYIGVLMDKHTVEVFDAILGEKIRDSGLVQVGGHAHLQTRSAPQK